MLNTSRLAAGLCGLLLFLLPAPAFPATMPAIQMKVVDSQDGSPVAGANVLFLGTAHEGTWTGHGGRSTNLFAAETTTDDAGEFHIPNQDFSSQPFFLNTIYDNPRLVVLKPGYVLLTLINTLRIIPSLDEVTMWQYNDQTVKMTARHRQQHSRHGLLRRAVRGSDHEPSERLWLEEGASLLRGSRPPGRRMDSEADDRCGSGRAQQIGQQSASADIDERAVLRRQRLRITEGVFRAVSSLSSGAARSS